MDKAYPNTPIYKTKLPSLQKILGVEKVSLRDINTIEREKTGIVMQVYQGFPENTFVERVSKKPL